MKICDNHPEYQVPLLGTFAFSGAEYWCPYCGQTSGMFGGGTDIKDTEKLIGRQTIYEKYSECYLHACGSLACSKMKLNDGMIKPAEMPEAVRREIKDIVKKGWAHDIKAIKLLKKETDEYPEFKCVHCELWKDCKDYDTSDIQICKKWKREVRP